MGKEIQRLRLWLCKLFHCGSEEPCEPQPLRQLPEGTIPVETWEYESYSIESALFSDHINFRIKVNGRLSAIGSIYDSKDGHHNMTTLLGLHPDNKLRTHLLEYAGKHFKDLK